VFGKATGVRKQMTRQLLCHIQPNAERLGGLAVHELATHAHRMQLVASVSPLLEREVERSMREATCSPKS